MPWWWQRPRISGKALRKTQGGLGPRDFLGLMESTQLAGLVTDSQEVAIQTNGGNGGGRLDAMTDGMMGGGGRTPPPTETKWVGDGWGWGVLTGASPTSRGDVTGAPWGGARDSDGDRE